MTPPPEGDPPPNLLKFQKRPAAKKADGSQRLTNFQLAAGIALLVAAALIWHFAVPT